MSDADYTPGREPRSIVASFSYGFKAHFGYRPKMLCLTTESNQE